MTAIKKEQLALKDVTVAFNNLDGDKFGNKTITVNITPEQLTQVEAWKSANNNPGGARLSEYNGQHQLQVKANDYTKFRFNKGVDPERLGFGAELSLVVEAFQYDNQFGKGISSSIKAILWTKSTADNDDPFALIDDGVELYTEANSIDDDDLPF